MSRALSARLLTAAALFALSVAGCGSSDSELAPVTGRVLLNGRPLAAVVVEFQPEGGSPAIGVTDDEGAFQLQYSKHQWGAPIGQHVVKIDYDVDGKHARKALPPLPSIYNSQSTLKREVVDGENSFEFDLLANVRTARNP